MENNKRGIFLIYMIDKGLQLSLNTKSKSKYPWWVIDIVEMVEISPNVYSAKDLFIDLKVFEDGRYQVLDIDEFETAIALGIIEEGHISKPLKSLNTALSELNNPEHWPIPLIEVAEKIRSELLVKR
ncbi:MAG: DUF402 domain-containing protein [Tuberibacillus sp.]